MSDLIAKITFNEEPLSPINQYAVRVMKRLVNGILIPFGMMYLPQKFTLYKKRFRTHAEKTLTIDAIYEGPIKVVIRYYFSSKRKKDIKNAGKLELDALNDLLYKDDDQITATQEEKFYDKNNPRIELEFYKHTTNGF